MTNSTQILSVIKDKKKTEMGLWDLGNPSYLSSNKERKITQDWLMRKIEEDDFNFGYFITLSFYKQTKKTINSYQYRSHYHKYIANKIDSLARLLSHSKQRQLLKILQSATNTNIATFAQSTIN